MLVVSNNNMVYFYVNNSLYVAPNQLLWGTYCSRTELHLGDYNFYLDGSYNACAKDKATSTVYKVVNAETNQMVHASDTVSLDGKYRLES